MQPTSCIYSLSLSGADNPSSRYQSPDFASRHAAEWFHIRTEKPCYQSQLLPLLMMSRVVYAERWVVCDSALHSQHIPCGCHGGEPSHALHIRGYQKYLSLAVKSVSLTSVL